MFMFKEQDISQWSCKLSIGYIWVFMIHVLLTVGLQRNKLELQNVFCREYYTLSLKREGWWGQAHEKRVSGLCVCVYVFFHDIYFFCFVCCFVFVAFGDHILYYSFCASCFKKPSVTSIHMPEGLKKRNIVRYYTYISSNIIHIPTSCCHIHTILNNWLDTRTHTVTHTIWGEKRHRHRPPIHA